MSTLISRDSFARQELHRERENFPGDNTCSFCGQVKVTLKGRPYLYRYYTETDSGRKHELRGLFCSVSCLRAYN